MVREEEKGGLSEKIAKAVVEAMKEEKANEKKFNLPLGIKIGSKGRIKKNYILVFLIRTNGQLLIKFLPIENDMIYLNGNDTYHIATTDYIGYYKNFPAIILPEWSLRPLQREKMMEETTANGELALPQKVIINAMKLAQVKPKSAIAGGKMIWLIVGIIVVVYLIYQMITGGQV